MHIELPAEAPPLKAAPLKAPSAMAASAAHGVGSAQVGAGGTGSVKGDARPGTGPIGTDSCGVTGNTLVSVGNGMKVKTQLHADGTYRTDTFSCSFAARRGCRGRIEFQFTSSGTWKKEKNGTICYTRTSRPGTAGPPSYLCAHNMCQMKVGDTWRELWPNGWMFDGLVVAG